jgi:signal transduction histidine kinase
MRAVLDPRSLQLELLLSLAAVMAAGLGTVAVVCVGLAGRTVEREALERLRMIALHVRRDVPSGFARLSDLAAVLSTVDPRGGAGSWRVVDAEGRSAWRARPSAREPDLRPLVAEARAQGEAVRGGLLARGDLLLAMPVRTLRGEEGAMIGIVAHAELWRRVQPLVAAAAWVFGISAAVFVGFGGYVLRRRIVEPVRALAAAAGRIAEGDLEARVHVSGCSELEELGAHFNEMAGSLSRQRRALIEAERSIAHGERLTSVGRLAAGIAHEVGNPVSAILGFVEVALVDRGISARTRDVVERVRSEASRIGSLIRELLDVSRPPELEIGGCAVDSLLRPLAERMAAHPSAAGVELVLELPEHLPRVRTDRRRAEQILLNLIENALHAAKVAERGSVRIVARAQSREGASPGRRREDREHRPEVALDVIDNGPGIPAEHLSRVFEPFFTTKDPGAGTGLGLWNAHRLSELLGARIELASRPGCTRFSLLLPVADTESDGAAARADR